MQPRIKRILRVSALLLLGAAVIGTSITSAVILLQWHYSKPEVGARVAKMFEQSGMMGGVKPAVDLNYVGGGVWTGTAEYEGGIVYQVTFNTWDENTLEWQRENRRGTLMKIRTP